VAGGTGTRRLASGSMQSSELPDSAAFLLAAVDLEGEEPPPSNPACQLLDRAVVQTFGLADARPFCFLPSARAMRSFWTGYSHVWRY
jgi:hypothetical protein